MVFFFPNFTLYKIFRAMQTFIGDYPCRLDAKGRVSIPSVFRKLFVKASENRFVLRKNIYEKCLDLYPMEEWQRQLDLIRSRMNPYNRKHSEFLREFYRGTAEVEVDGNGRILIPSRLADYAGLQKEVVLAGQDGKIEIWNRDAYEKASLTDEEFMDLANDVLGGNN